MTEPLFRVLIAPASFKGSISALQAAEWISEYLGQHGPAFVEYRLCPVADGGDDTLAVLQQAYPDSQRQTASVTGPIPSMAAQANYLWLPAQKTIVIEAAQAHGMALLPSNTLAPMAATSFGVGELIRQAIQMFQPDTMVISVGGSASTDGGLGALQAMGVIFRDAHGQTLDSPLSGKDLSVIQSIEWPTHWAYSGKLLIATDVVNPLLGPDGCAQVFAPQKGATQAQCAQLETGLTHFSQLMSATTGVDLSTLPGSGAAGGLAYGLRHLPRSGIVSGSQWVADALNLLDQIAWADLIITGEGRFDTTSFAGKATGHILVWAEQKPVFVFCGQSQARWSAPDSVSVFSLTQPGETPDTAMKNPKAALQLQLEVALPVLQSLISKVASKPSSSPGDNCTN